MHHNVLARSVHAALIAGFAVFAAVTPSAAQVAGPAGAHNESADSKGVEAPPPSGPTTTNMETISVTGTRASIEKSQAIKRDAQNFVDAISAEDIGKFPDPNVAEALQRVTGVAIGRDTSGEGKKLSVRGLGPEFVTTLLNGRRLASEDSTRAFNFDVLPSEIIQTAEVNKSALPYMTDGGSGATIDIRTLRPLDRPGFHVAGSLAGVYDTLSKDTKPRGSGAISVTNEENTLGFALALSDYERTAQQQFYAAKYRRVQDQAPGSPLQQHMMDLGLKAIPWNADYGIEDDRRKRTGVNAAFDWKISDDLTLRLDGLQTKWTQSHDGTSTNFEPYVWARHEPNYFTKATADQNGTATYLLAPDGGGMTVNDWSEHDPRNSKTNGFGANLEWKMVDSTTAKLDLWHSKARSEIGFLGILIQQPVTAGTKVEWFNGGANRPSYYIGKPDIDDPSHIGATWSSEGNNIVKEAVTEAKLDFDTRFNEGVLSRLDYGVYRGETKKTLWAANSPGDITCYYCDGNSVLPASFFKGFTNVPDLLGGQYPHTPTRWIAFDYANYFNILKSPYMLNQVQNPSIPPDQLLAKYPGGFAPLFDPSTYSEIHEKVTAAYLQGTFEGTAGSVPWNVIAGVRVVKTQVESSGLVTTIAGFEPVHTAGGNVHDRLLLSEPTPIARSSSYTETLPSITAKFNLTDQLIARAAAYRTLTRPQLDLMRVNDTYTQNIGNFTLTRGNPALKPFIANNYDVALEYYMNDATSFSATGFVKNVNGFTSLETFSTLIQNHPFQVSEPVNVGSARIWGAELAAQYVFDFLPSPFDGLGVQANYTKVKSNRQYNPALGAAQLAITGLSDTANLIGFYDKGPFSVRLAWNWRDRYNEDAGNGTYVEPFKSLDASASYMINRNFSVFAEATNLTDEQSIRWIEYNNRVTSIYRAGGTYTVGVRAKW